MLICVYGNGWYQEEGKKARLLKPGDIVNIPANVKHWHGATKDSYFQHLAIEVAGENTSTSELKFPPTIGPYRCDETEGFFMKPHQTVNGLCLESYVSRSRARLSGLAARRIRLSTSWLWMAPPS